MYVFIVTHSMLSTFFVSEHAVRRFALCRREKEGMVCDCVCGVCVCVKKKVSQNFFAQKMTLLEFFRKSRTQYAVSVPKMTLRIPNFDPLTDFWPFFTFLKWLFASAPSPAVITDDLRF